MSTTDRHHAQDLYRQLREVIGIAISAFREVSPTAPAQIGSLETFLATRPKPYPGSPFHSDFNPAVNETKHFVAASGFLRLDLPEPNSDTTGLPLGQYGERVGASLLLAHEHLIRQLQPFCDLLRERLQDAHLKHPDLDIPNVVGLATSNGAEMIKSESDATPEERFDAAVNAVFGVVIEGMTTAMDAVNFLLSHRHPSQKASIALGAIAASKRVNRFAVILPGSIIGTLNYNGLVPLRPPMDWSSPTPGLTVETEKWIAAARTDSMPHMRALRNRPGRATAGFICAAASVELPVDEPATGVGGYRGERRRASEKKYFLDELTELYCDTAADIVRAAEREPNVSLAAAGPSPFASERAAEVPGLSVPTLVGR